MKLTAQMKEMLRGRCGLSPFDTSKDVAILEMSPVEVVRECTAWKLGDPFWATEIAAWMVAAGANPKDF